MILFALLLLPVIVLWKAFALSTLWGWFIVPLGVQPIGIAWAIGITCIVGLVGNDHKRDPKQPKDDAQAALIHALTVAFVKPGLLLLIGLVAKWWMPV